VTSNSPRFGRIHAPGKFHWLPVGFLFSPTVVLEPGITSVTGGLFRHKTTQKVVNMHSGTERNSNPIFEQSMTIRLPGSA